MPEAIFKAGRNIAMKVPPHLYEETVRFYRDLLGLKQIKQHEPAVVFEYGDQRLWIDAMESVSQPEIWLEIVTNNLPEAEKRFGAAGIVRCDEVEALPSGYQGFWIRSPAGVVHLISAGK